MPRFQRSEPCSLALRACPSAMEIDFSHGIGCELEPIHLGLCAILQKKNRAWYKNELVIGESN
jgi:hypothetical protein